MGDDAPVYYFVTGPDGGIPDKWWKRISSGEIVRRPDALYKCTNRSDVTAGDITFCVFEATISDLLSKQKNYRVVEIAQGVCFYFDDEFGFLEFREASERSGDHAVEIFNKMITREPPYMFFLD